MYVYREPVILAWLGVMRYSSSAHHFVIISNLTFHKKSGFKRLVTWCIKPQCWCMVESWQLYTLMSWLIYSNISWKIYTHLYAFCVIQSHHSPLWTSVLHDHKQPWNIKVPFMVNVYTTATYLTFHSKNSEQQFCHMCESSILSLSHPQVAKHSSCQR